MNNNPDHDLLDAALRRCGSSWNAGQAHGFLCSQLAILGEAAGHGWFSQVLADAAHDDALRGECASLLEQLFLETRRQFAERQSEFEPLLPDESVSLAGRAAVMAQWCEGYLHGLVSEAQAGQLRERLATEPLADIVRDMLQITRAGVDEQADDEDDEQNLGELIEYLRVAAQLVYEELAELRGPSAPAAAGGDDRMH